MEKTIIEGEKIFWVDGDYEAVGGIYLRNDIFKFFDVLKEKGITPVGIKIDGTWNLEIIVKKDEAYEKHFHKGSNPQNE